MEHDPTTTALPAVMLPPGVLSERDPSKILADASKKAKLLKKVVQAAHLEQRIGSSTHLRIEGWLTMARFYGLFPTIEWSKPILSETSPDTLGYIARAQVIHLETGQIVSAAEMECRTDEPNWKGKPLFQVRSMAQTRAVGKALRNVLAWSVVLAGYQATPSEEMTGEDVVSTHTGLPLVTDPLPIEQQITEHATHIGIPADQLASIRRVAAESPPRVLAILQGMATGLGVNEAIKRAYEQFPRDATPPREPARGPATGSTPSLA